MLNYLTQLPMPHLNELVPLMKIRIMKGLLDGELPAAFAEVRHLGRLLYTTEDIIGELLAVALLGVERVAYQYAVSQGRLNPGDWKSIPQDLHDKAKRVIFGTWGYFHPMTPPEVLSKVFGPGTPAIGKCAAIREGTITASSVDRHLYPHVPFERDYRSNYDTLRAIATDARNGCRLPDIRTYWNNPLAFRGWLDDSWSEITDAFLTRPEDPWIPLSMFTYRIPYIRKALGAWIATIGTPSAFRRYEEARTPAASDAQRR